MLDVALHQDKLANLFKQLTAHVEPFFFFFSVNTITELRYMTISPITTVKSNIKYRTSKYSKNGICNENKQIKNTKQT
jgi:LytS/YehU family sensor histidine kinase